MNHDESVACAILSKSGFEGVSCFISEDPASACLR